MSDIWRRRWQVSRQDRDGSGKRRGGLVRRQLGGSGRYVMAEGTLALGGSTHSRALDARVSTRSANAIARSVKAHRVGSARRDAAGAVELQEITSANSAGSLIHRQQHPSRIENASLASLRKSPQQINKRNLCVRLPEGPKQTLLPGKAHLARLLSI
jgi:hypothetical protein